MMNHTDGPVAGESDQTGGPLRTPATMQAVVTGSYGRPDVMEYRTVAVPTPEDGQVLVRVVASSLNMFDWHMLTGTPYMVRAVAGRTRPKHAIQGADLAGVVVEVGPDVEAFAVGDEVFGDIGKGAFAEYAVANVKAITHKPKRVSFEAAAATPLAAITALQALRDHGELESGQRILINGASGGVGTFAVQIAKALGAEVTAVCSTTKVGTVRSIGADHVVDYTKDDYTATERGYDLIFDNVGDRGWRTTSKVLVPGGRNVTITGPKRAVLGPFRSLLTRKVASRFGHKSMTWFTAHVSQSDLDVLADMLESGDIVPVLEKAYPLERLPDALTYLGEGHALGKVVITV